MCEVDSDILETERLLSNYSNSKKYHLYDKIYYSSNEWLDEIFSNFDFYGNQGFFQDLTTIFPTEELASYEDRLYYVDLPNDNKKTKVPIGIKIDKSAKICKTSCYPNMDAYWGVLSGSKRVDKAVEYLEYLEQ